MQTKRNTAHFCLDDGTTKIRFPEGCDYTKAKRFIEMQRDLYEDKIPDDIDRRRERRKRFRKIKSHLQQAFKLMKEMDQEACIALNIALRIQTPEDMKRRLYLDEWTSDCLSWYGGHIGIAVKAMEELSKASRGAQRQSEKSMILLLLAGLFRESTGMPTKVRTGPVTGCRYGPWYEFAADASRAIYRTVNDGLIETVGKAEDLSFVEHIPIT